MNRLSLLYHLIRADFLERVRRYSFLITLVLALYLGYIYIPDSSAGYVTVSLDGVRGAYNSAWVGGVFSLLTSIFLSLIGFYLVKNAVARDYDTRVGQILASTPLSKFSYLLGKTLSNFAVLSAIAMAMLVSAAAMQLIRGEDANLNLWQLASPTLFMALPCLLVVSAIAVLFEVTPLLRGSLGNVAYFAVWNVTLVLSMLSAEDPGKVMREGYNDLPGLTWILTDMIRSGSAVLQNFKGNVNIGFLFVDGPTAKPAFVWQGMDWTIGLLSQRLMWAGLAIGVVLAATPIFRRFDTASLRKDKKHKGENGSTPPVVAAEAAMPIPRRLTELSRDVKPSFSAMLIAELGLMFKSASRWWYLIAAGLASAMLFTPLTVAREFILPAAWIWPVALWSAMGTRERRFGTEQIIFSSPQVLSRQVPALWLSGVAVAAATGSGMAVRFLIAGDGAGLFAWGVGALFIPTMALAAGVWTGRQLLFEALYVGLWYIGPMNHIPVLDYMGASSKTTPATTVVFLLVTVILFALAVIGRKRQISY